jgi:hypothetical protein
VETGSLDGWRWVVDAFNLLHFNKEALAVCPTAADKTKK